MKRQTVEWKKITANHVSDMQFIASIHKELLKLNNIEHTTQFKNEPKT